MREAFSKESASFVLGILYITRLVVYGEVFKTLSVDSLLL